MRAKEIAAVGLVVVLVVLLLGCGEEGNQETVEKRPQRSQKPPVPDKKLKSMRLTLEGYADAESVGILMADQRGYFADAGLEVDVLSPAASDNVPEYVAQEIDDIGLLAQPEVVLARDKGMPLVAVGSLVPRPTMGMIWLGKSKIDGVAGLAGKTIAINGLPAEEGFLQAILAQAGLTFNDVKIKRLGYLLVPALVKGRADAILGSGNMEGAELEARGLAPVVTPLQRLGIPSYEELVVITRRDRLAGDPRLFHTFMSAIARGTAAAVADPEAAVEAIATARTEIGYADPQKPVVSKAKVEATLPLLSRTGRMSPGRATRLVDWMNGQELTERKLPASVWLTNEYVR